MKRVHPLNLLALFLFGSCLLFVLLPLLHLFFSLSSRKFLATLTDGEVWQAVKVSFLAASGATTLGVVFGVPAGFFLARHRFRGREVLESLLNLPVVIPHVAVGILLLNLLNENAPLGRFFAAFHLTFVDTIYGIMVAMCFVSLSYVVSAALLGFRAVDPDLELAARTLGASPWYTFSRITLPLLFPYVLRGGVLAFARSVSEVGALLILAYYPKTAPILLYERFENYGLASARPIAALIVLLSLVLFTLLVLVSRRQEGKQAGGFY